MLYPKRNCGLSFDKHKDNFIRWLSSRTTEYYAKKSASYLNRFASGMIISTPEEIFEIVNKSTSKKYMTIALRDLIKYYEEFDLSPPEIIARLRKPLKSVQSNTDTYIPNTETVVRLTEVLMLMSIEWYSRFLHFREFV